MSYLHLLCCILCCFPVHQLPLSGKLQPFLLSEMEESDLPKRSKLSLPYSSVPYARIALTLGILLLGYAGCRALLRLLWAGSVWPRIGSSKDTNKPLKPAPEGALPAVVEQEVAPAPPLNQTAPLSQTAPLESAQEDGSEQSDSDQGPPEERAVEENRPAVVKREVAPPPPSQTASLESAEEDGSEQSDEDGSEQSDSDQGPPEERVVEEKKPAPVERVEEAPPVKRFDTVTDFGSALQAYLQPFPLPEGGQIEAGEARLFWRALSATLKKLAHDADLSLEQHCTCFILNKGDLVERPLTAQIWKEKRPQFILINSSPYRLFFDADNIYFGDREPLFYDAPRAWCQVLKNAVFKKTWIRSSHLPWGSKSNLLDPLNRGRKEAFLAVALLDIGSVRTNQGQKINRICYHWGVWDTTSPPARFKQVYAPQIQDHTAYPLPYYGHPYQAGVANHIEQLKRHFSGQPSADLLQRWDPGALLSSPLALVLGQAGVAPHLTPSFFSRDNRLGRCDLLIFHKPGITLKLPAKKKHIIELHLPNKQCIEAKFSWPALPFDKPIRALAYIHHTKGRVERGCLERSEKAVKAVPKKELIDLVTIYMSTEGFAGQEDPRYYHTTRSTISYGFKERPLNRGATQAALHNKCLIKIKNRILFTPAVESVPLHLEPRRKRTFLLG